MADNIRAKVTYTLFQCLRCEHTEKVSGNREDYSEVTVCPKCNGAIVDRWNIAKYKLKHIDDVDWSSGKDHASRNAIVNIDCSNTIKGLKAIQREARKATVALKELETIESKIESAYGIPAELLKGNPNKVNEQYETFIKLMGIQEAGP